MGLLFCRNIASKADNVQHGASSDTHGSIQAGSRKLPEGLNDGHVSSSSGIDITLLTKHGRNLARDDIDGGTSHEGGNGWQGNKINNKAETEETEGANNCTADNC